MILSLALAAHALPLGLQASPRPEDQYDAAGRIVRAAGGALHSYDTDAAPPLWRAPVQVALTSAPTPAGGYCTFGSGVGLSDIAIADDGANVDVVVGGSGLTFGENQWWQILRWDGSGLGTRLFGPFYAAGIQRLAVGNVRSEPGLELVILSGGVVEVRSMADGAVLDSFPGLPGATGMLLADVAAGPLAEILLAAPNEVRGLHGSGTVLFTESGIGGSDLAVGQLDGDAALELATTDGRILDLATFAIQCTWPSAFGVELEAHDIDGDGLDELVYADMWNWISTFDADLCLPKGSFQNFNTGAMRLLDVDGDGDREMVVGDAQWGSVHVHDPLTFAALGQINNPEHGTTDVAVVDVDGDGEREMLWGAGATSTGADRLYVGSLATGAIEWENVQLEGPLVGPEEGDIDGDGTPEVAFVSWTSDAGYGAGRIVVLDAASLAVEGISQQVAGGLGWTGVHDLRLANADADPALEIVLATGTTYDGLIEIWGFDGASFSLQSKNLDLPIGATFYAADVVDLEGDGSLESIGITGVEHTGASGASVIAYDVATGAKEWESIPVGLGFATGRGLLVKDFDADGVNEIVAFVKDGDAYVWDGATKQLEEVIPGAFRSAGALPRAGGFQLILGDAAGDLHAPWLGGGSTLVLGTLPIEGFSFGPSRTLLVSRGSLYEVRQPLSSPTPLWSTESYGSECGKRTVVQTDLARTLMTSQYACVALLWF